MKVLIVEDNAGEAALLTEALGRETDLRVAGSLAEAAVALDNGRPEILLLDLGLPDSRGLDTLALAVDLLPEAAILVLVEPSHESLAAEAVQAGAQGYVVKGRTDARLLKRSLGLASRRKRDELESRALLRLHQGILGTIPLSILALDRELRVITANRHPLSGVQEEGGALLGRKVEDLVPAEVLGQEHLLDRLRAIAAGRPEDEISGIKWQVAGRPPRYFDVRAARVDLAEGARVLVILSDVTRQRELQGQVMQAMKMETVGQLAGGVAHDFNNILTGILGYSQLLSAETSGPESQRKDLQQITELAERGARLTRQLLLFSRKQPLEKRPQDVNELLGGTVKMLRRLIGEHIELDFRPGEGLQAVEADRGQVEQVVMNLAVNARDAMGGGGKLRIETAAEILDEEYAAAHVGVRPGHYAMISVTDNGSGMDRETQSHIFEPFFTTKEVGKGTGLGLATVYGIVKEHGGNVWVYSEPGQGTTFKVYLPMQSAGSLGSSSSQGGQAPGGNERILLVEDEPGVRAVVHRALSSRGYEVEVAEGPEQARAWFEARGRGLDLLLTDVSMPGMTGPDLYQRLAPLEKGMKVLFMSGYPDASALEKAGPDAGFIQKPFSPESLARKVREVLDGGTKPAKKD